MKYLLVIVVVREEIGVSYSKLRKQFISRFGLIVK